jgi:hypothetical protein
MGYKTYENSKFTPKYSLGLGCTALNWASGSSILGVLIVSCICSKVLRWS